MLDWEAHILLNVEYKQTFQHRSATFNLYKEAWFYIEVLVKINVGEFEREYYSFFL